MEPTVIVLGASQRQYDFCSGLPLWDRTGLNVVFHLIILSDCVLRTTDAQNGVRSQSVPVWFSEMTCGSGFKSVWFSYVSTDHALVIDSYSVIDDLRCLNRS